MRIAQTIGDPKKKLLILFLFLLLPFAVQAFPKGDGKITFYNYHTGEILETNTKNLEKINRFFHSRLEGEVHPINPKLIDLLDNIQDHFHADVIELISGYRSPTLNANLRREGYEVAEASQHIQGNAADIHLDEVTEEGLAAYVKSLKVGGVGYYPKNDFVHVDVGEVRYWELPDTPSRPFIAMRKGPVWQIYTDKNIYLPGETVEIFVTNLSRKEQTLPNKAHLELFRRGKWLTLPLPPPLKGGGIPDFSSPLVGEGQGEGKKFILLWKPNPKNPFGKFRIVLPQPNGFPHLQVRSNEFYRKRF